MAEFSFHHGAASVPDLEAAIDWYGHVLGYEVEKRFRIPPASTNVAMLRKGSMRIELFCPDDAAGTLAEDRRIPQRDILTHGNKHVAWRIDNLDDFMAEMDGKGVEIVFVVRECFGSGCFIRDCAGNLLEFVEEPNL